MNRKITVIALSLLLTCALFSGCKKYSKDETNCYIGFEEVKQAAKKSGKPILVMLTQEEGEQNGGSKYFVENILTNKEFADYCKTSFELYRMDFSTKNIQKTAVNEDASKKEIQQAEQFAEYFQQGVQLATYFGVNYTPAFYILTKDGYFVSEVYYTEDALNVGSFIEILQGYEQQVNYIEGLVSATKNGTVQERITAIDSLYSVTPMAGQFFLGDFARTAVEIDPENTTGVIGKYYFFVADEKASILYKNQDAAGAIQAYIDAAESGKMEPDYVQQCYYMSAWILESISSMDSDLLIGYLQKAYDAAPDSLYAENILESIEYYKTQFSSIDYGNISDFN